MSWPTVTLAAVCTKPQYGAIASGTDESVGPLFVRQTDLNDGRVTWQSVPHCELADSDVTKYRLTPDDLLVARLGSVGRAARVLDIPQDAVFAGYLVRFRANGEVADPAFIGYQLRSPAWWDHVNAVRSGAVQPTLNAQQMASFRFPQPPLAEQRGIAATLGALDDKIESNRRIIEMVPGLIRMKLCAALEGMSTSVAVADLADFVNGGAYTKGASGTGRMVIRIAELNSGPGGSTVFNDIDVPEDRTARPGDILMAWSGSLGVHRWVLGEAIVNQHIFKVIPAPGFPAWLVFDRLEDVMPVFRGIAKDKATTMGHIQRGHLSATEVEVPEPTVMENLNPHMQPLWDRLLVAEQENLRLASLRDALLPELLSGRIRVPEAEQAVVEVIS